MELTFCTIGSPDELEPVKDLYLTAFPAHERRTYEGFRKQVEMQKDCIVNIITKGESVVGFFTFWEFEDFGFVEHMAIESKYRGRKYGEKTLFHITMDCKKPILLEVEPPMDEDSRRRIDFYMRNGFQILAMPYFQPSYDGIHPETEMRLMSNSTAFTQKQLSKYISQIHFAVYGQRDDPDVKN